MCRRIFLGSRLSGWSRWLAECGTGPVSLVQLVPVELGHSHVRAGEFLRAAADAYHLFALLGVGRSHFQAQLVTSILCIDPILCECQRESRVAIEHRLPCVRIGSSRIGFTQIQNVTVRSRLMKKS